jgi:DNA-binding transcriptional MerR regulator
MERLISIGQFAQLSGLSPKAIRLYGDLGLLTPAVVDDWTGYRRFHPDQLPRARMIALLRRSGISLSEISAFLLEPTVERVEQWERELEHRVENWRKHLDAVRTLLVSAEEENKEQAMEIGQQTKLSRAVPILASTNLDETVRFYENRLRFKTAFQSEDYAILKRDDVSVHFWVCEDEDIPKVTACRVEVKGIDELYRECVAADIVHPNGALEKKAWGSQEFAIIDVHGNLITFFE